MHSKKIEHLLRKRLDERRVAAQGGLTCLMGSPRRPALRRAGWIMVILV